MKFSTSKYWRLRGVCGAFMEIITVIEDTGESAVIKVNWCTQFPKSWRPLAEEVANIHTRHYNYWIPYFPRGDRLEPYET